MKRKISTSVKAGGSAFVAAGLLTACFGGGNDSNSGPTSPPAASTSVPASALVSSAAYESFTDSTIASSTSETTEPLTADNVDTAPASETDEPASVS
jgi:hypothetical protein